MVINMRKYAAALTLVAVTLAGCTAVDAGTDPMVDTKTPAPYPTLAADEFDQAVAACREAWIAEGVGTLYPTWDEAEAGFDRQYDIDGAIAGMQGDRWIVKIPWQSTVTIKDACEWVDGSATVYRENA